MMWTLKRISAAAAVASMMLAGGCSSSVDNAPDVTATDPSSGTLPGGPTTPVEPPEGLRALFQVAQGILPWPNDLYFSGSTDGTLNIQPANALIPAQAALNALDGWSTTAPIRARFSGAIAPASLTPASVRVVRVNIDNSTKATVGVVNVLVPGVDYSVDVATDAGVGNQIVEITPLRPLVPSTGATNNGYLVLLTNGITDTAGAPAVADADYATIKAALAADPNCGSITNATLNGVCRLTGAHLQIAQGVGFNPADVVLSFSFSTQSIGDTLEVVSATAAAQPIGVQATGFTTAQANPALQGKADIHVGTLTIPYYLSRAEPLTGSWAGNPSPLDASSRHLTRFNPLPVATESLTIPLLVTVPNATSLAGAARPANGWPVVIFQHGITGNRTQMLAIADAFADAGFVVAAIDLPLHGLTAPSPFYQEPNERTFNLDVVDNASGAPGADGVIDSSGTHFINLSSLLTSRDNVRQSSSDLITLTRSLPTLDVTGDGAGDVDATRIHFVGMSLGAITGVPFLAVEPAVQSATLAVPGGKVAYLLRDSPTFGPRINAGLQAQGLVAGTTLYNQFFRDAQTVIDSGDPWTYMNTASEAHSIHLIQVVGGAGSPPDQVIPNSATARLIEEGELPKVNTPGMNPVTHGYVSFVAGDHGSLLSPAASLPATIEMQRQTVTFAATGGNVIAIADPTVIE